MAGLETARPSVLGDKHNVVFISRFPHCNERVSFRFEIESILSISVDSGIVSKFGALDDAFMRCEDKVVSLWVFLQLFRDWKDGHDTLIITDSFNDVTNVCATAQTTAHWCLPCFQSIDASLISENQQTVLAETSENGFREILVFCSDAFEPLSTSILNPEGFYRHVANVVVLGQRNYNRSFLNQVLSVHREWHWVDV